MTRPSRLSTAIVIGVLALNAVDLVLHIVTDQVEPLRVTANAVVLLACVLALTVGRRMTQLLAAIGALVTLVLNLVVITTDGLGPAGFVFVIGTVLGLGVVAALGSSPVRR